MQRKHGEYRWIWPNHISNIKGKANWTIAGTKCSFTVCSVESFSGQLEIGYWVPGTIHVSNILVMLKTLLDPATSSHCLSEPHYI